MRSPERKAGLFRDGSGHDLANDRLRVGPIQPQPDASKRIALEAFQVERRQIERAPGEPLFGIDHFELRGLLLDRELQQPPANLLPAGASARR